MSQCGEELRASPRCDIFYANQQHNRRLPYSKQLHLKIVIASCKEIFTVGRGLYAFFDRVCIIDPLQVPFLQNENNISLEKEKRPKNENKKKTLICQEKERNTKAPTVSFVFLQRLKQDSECFCFFWYIVREKNARLCLIDHCGAKLWWRTL